MNERMEELLAIYALGGLMDDEAREVELFVAENDEAQAELQELMQTTAVLPQVAFPVQPSSSLEASLFARVTADAEKRFPAATPRRAPRQNLLEIVRSWFSMPLVGGVSVALAVLVMVFALSLNRQVTNLQNQVADQNAQLTALESQVANLEEDNLGLNGNVSDLTTENVSLRKEVQTLEEEKTASEELASSMEQQLLAVLNEREDLVQEYSQAQSLNVALQNDLTQAQEVLTLFSSPDAYYVSLPGTETQPQAQAQMIVDPEGQVAVLFVEGMEPLEAGKVYQVLLIRDDGHDTAETFAVGGEGKSALIVHSQAPFDTFTSIGVSVEPEGGSPQRTGDIILLGSIES